MTSCYHSADRLAHADAPRYARGRRMERHGSRWVLARRVWIGGLVGWWALVGGPAAPAVACTLPSVPIYPEAEAPDGAGLSASGGSMFIATTAPLVDIQAFYYTRLPNEGWGPGHAAARAVP